METEQAPKRKYQEVWERLVNNPKGVVRIKVRTTELMRRVRKAVWKEKDLDLENRGKWRLICEMFPEEGILIFSLKEKLDEGSV